GVEVYLRNGDGDLHGPPLFITKSDDNGFFGFPVGRGTYTVYSQGITSADTKYSKALFDGSFGNTKNPLSGRAQNYATSEPFDYHIAWRTVHCMVDDHNG